ncbi:hypothetical protein [Gordonia sp. (in: high G+C Gram-positive bacteria)]|uniref:hypothetical protein n=1 Tax=Gordonia sp. (in: high G+C Gram-positive bacteria) TaxID=84139 RepID=UPI003F9974F1
MSKRPLLGMESVPLSEVDDGDVIVLDGGFLGLEDEPLSFQVLEVNAGNDFSAALNSSAERITKVSLIRHEQSGREFLFKSPGTNHVTRSFRMTPDDVVDSPGEACPRLVEANEVWNAWMRLSTLTEVDNLDDLNDAISEYNRENGTSVSLVPAKELPSLETVETLISIHEKKS